MLCYINLFQTTNSSSSSSSSSNSSAEKVLDMSTVHVEMSQDDDRESNNSATSDENLLLPPSIGKMVKFCLLTQSSNISIIFFNAAPSYDAIDGNVKQLEENQPKIYNLSFLGRSKYLSL